MDSQKVRIVDTTLRDGHQSLMATRLRLSDVEAILETLNEIGFYSMEVWGGATFDACVRFLNENPFERLKTFRKKLSRPKLQMLLRGQNLLGYRHYADDVVDKFIAKSIEHGIDIIRIFDALNDFRNIERAVQATLKYGGEPQGALSYTVSPVHDIPYYLKKAKELEQMGAKSICIKDMSGVLLPMTAFELIQKMKKEVSIPIDLHTHFTAGIGYMTYMKAIEAGVDIIDTGISTLAGGTAQPCLEPLAFTYEKTPNAFGLDMDKVAQVADFLKPVREKYMKDGTWTPTVYFTDPQILKYQVPGGMLSNLLSQLKQQNAVHRYEEVLSEIGKVSKEVGYPPLVTPMSQIVATQSVINVLTGDRYGNPTSEIKDYLSGKYGQAPAPIDPEVQKKCVGDIKVITHRPADDIAPEWDKLKTEIGSLAKSDEDVLIYALFANQGKEFLEKRDQKNEGEEIIVNISPGVYA